MADPEIGELLESIDMESYLDREGVDYKITHGSSGTQINVKECPVCGNSSWKVYLNAETGVGNCFAGDHPPGENFSKWRFIKALTGIENGRDVYDHIRQVAREMGWRARRTTSAAVVLEKPDLVIPESYSIPIAGKNLKYLSDRNIDIDTASFFNLRYCHKGVFWYRDSSDDKFKFQTYDKRIIIPIFDLNGELVSFQGRDVTGNSKRKYLFPPGYSSTGKYLYNAHNVVGLEHVVVGEGAFDVMATKIALDEELTLRDVGVVGTFGKHLSHGSMNGEDQLNKFIELKKQGLKMVTLMWDGEKAATRAALEAATLLNGVGLTTRLAILPEGKDPNEIAPSALRRAFWSAAVMNKQTMLRMRLALS